MRFLGGRGREEPRDPVTARADRFTARPWLFLLSPAYKKLLSFIRLIVPWLRMGMRTTLESHENKFSSFQAKFE